MIERDRNINIRDSENNSIVTNNVVNRSSTINFPIYIKKLL